MLAKRIIPCLDVNDGRVVKGVHFTDLADAGDPVAAAIEYDRQGADELVFLDITASCDARDSVADVISKTADRVFIPLTVGGGIRTVHDIRKMLQCGADKVSLNTSAVLNPEFIQEGANRFGAQCIVLAVDAKRAAGGNRWEVYTHGGRCATGIDVLDWVRYGVKNGAGEILLTSMDSDGTKKGYDCELISAVTSVVNVPVIASGGAGNPEDLAEAFSLGHADAVLAASIFHFGTYTIDDVKNYLAEHGFPVRFSSHDSLPLQSV